MNDTTLISNGINPDEQVPLGEKLLYSLAHSHRAEYPHVTFEEARSDTYAGFMKACRNYKIGKGTKFSTWCRLVAWGELKSCRMSEARKYFPTEPLLEEVVGEIPDERKVNLRVTILHDNIHPRESLGTVLIKLFREAPREMIGLSEVLSEDAKEMLALFTEATQDVAVERHTQCKKARQLFAQKVGWERADKAYAEVRNSLLEAFA